MKLIGYISSLAMPFIIVCIILYGVKEKNKVFDTFLDGAKEGLEIVLKIFPTLIGLFLAIGLLRSSGILDLIIHIISPVIDLLKIPKEIMPLAMLRPISGSASMAVATDIMTKYGTDSLIRNDYIYDYGIYRNNFLYNCNLYKRRRSKENKICFSGSIDCRYSWNASFCNILSNIVNEKAKKQFTNTGKGCKMIT